MQLFFSEYPQDYSKYHFPYQVYLKMEPGDDYARIYQSGFLPIRSIKDVFYLARSSRVKLHGYEPSSENRRILAKMEPLSLSVEPVDQFELTAAIQKFCTEAAKKVGGGNSTIPTSAIRKMFTGQANVNQVMIFKDSKFKILGIVGIVTHGTFVHYAHPFIDATSDDKNLNIGMMTRAVEWAYNQRKQFIYLGTLATPGSLYKDQFKNFQFFNGVTWSENQAELKGLVGRQNEKHLLEDEDFQSKFVISGLDFGSVISPFRARMK